ncbi:amino acid adenylation domain-containing protein [Pseudomonas sp. DTU_2021_1001937_2_SI_NGA_ILE_001]|uniref:amino acid adenylation domain-containing protein n=1 Tax=Pseudomonas sp. DTU_2021_1001937_2_SI_NGA_ILE_001 TaxID=3077589 RepID=UPI00397A8486
MNSQQKLDLVTRFVQLPLAQRKQFFQRLQDKGMSFDQLPIPATCTTDEAVPLSYAQARQWFLWQMDPHSSAYHIPTALRLRGPLHIEALQASFDALCARHASLRTRLRMQGDQPVQQVLPEARLVVQREALQAADDARIRQWVEASIAQPFELLDQPLLRVALVDLGPDDHLLVMVQHHVMSDAWSMQVMVRELIELYQGQCEGRTPALPPLPIQYADYALWQRRVMEAGERERQLAYWTQALAGEQPVLELPFDRPRPAEQSFRGAQLAIELDSDLAAGLKHLAQRSGVTLFTLLLASFQVLLHRQTQQPDIRVGVPVANRNRAETQGLIGFFVNTQVLRAEVDGQQPFSELLEQVARRTRDAQAHPDLPFEHLVDALQPERSLSHNPLFQVMFNHQAGSGAAAGQRVGGLRIEGLAWDTHSAQFDLTLDTRESAHGLEASLTYATDLFDAATAERLGRHWRYLLQAVVADPQTRIAELRMLDQAEQRQILAQCNPQPAQFATHTTLHAVIEAQVARRPDAVALTCGDRQLTYQDLNLRANRLAHRLIELGVRPETRVGIALQRSPELLVGLLAILKAGGAYVPLDPHSPAERLNFLVQDSGVNLLLLEAELRERLVLPEQVRALLLDDDDSLATAGDHNPDVPMTAHNLAYVIYTSGSTGQPKGTLLPHGNVLRLFAATQAWFGFDEHDVWTLFHSCAFDFSVWELFGALLQGGRLVIVPYETSRSPEDFHRLLLREQVTVLNQTPSAFKQLMAVACQAESRATSLRYVIFGGEALEVRSLAPWFERFGDRAPQLVNMYGITETTVHVTYRPLSCHDLAPAAQRQASSPIGQPIPDMSWHLLDGGLHPVPQGCTGELYVGRAGLARGYLGRPGLTALRFVPDPFGEPGARLYRSGDLARFLGGGVFDYVGRIDHQVKIRGFRIELGEIESRLLEQPGVRQAVVLATKAGSGAQLFGYVVTDAPLGEAAQGAWRDTLRGALQASLPDYMVPTYLIALDALPLTTNGKLDRRALPAPDASLAQQHYVEPVSDMQRRIAAIWAEVLKLERVGLNDNFFELGGDSIISIQVVSRARQAGIHFTPKALFQHQTVQGLASVAEAQAQTAPLQHVAAQGETALLPIQHWFFEQAVPHRERWNQSVWLRPGAVLDADALDRALQALVRHHDGLRLRFEQGAEGWRASYAEAEQAAVVSVWRTRAATGEHLQAIADEAQGSLDLRQGPLLRAVLVDLDEGGQRLLVVIHHLVVDGVSWRILLEDLHSAYPQAAAGQTVVLPPRSSSIKDWAACLSELAASDTLQGQAGYWQAQLQGACTDLPEARPGASLAIRHAAHAQTRLNPAQTRHLLQQAPGAYRTQVNDLLLTALARVIARWTGQPQVLVQLEGHGREELDDSVDLTRTVGWFTSLFPVRLTPGETLAASIKGIKEQLRAIPDKGIGYGVLRYLGDADTRARLAELPEPRITFNYLGQFDTGTGDAPALFSPSDEPRGAELHGDAPLGNWLSLNGQVFAGELSLAWTFSRQMFDEALIQRLADDYRDELVALIAHCCQPDCAALTPSDVPLAALQQAQLDALPVAAQRIEDIYPLSPMQQGMLFHTLYDEQGGDYINQMRMDVRGLDAERFRAAWQDTLNAHEVLRSGFLWQGGLERPLQIVQRQVSLPLIQLDWRDDADCQAKIAARVAADRAQGFGAALETGAAPLLRLTLIRTGEQSHHLIYTSHHILMDGWSNSQLLGEVLQRYAGQSPRPPQGRYRDYIAWLQAHDPAADQRFWTSQLQGLEQPTRLAQVLSGEAADAQGHGNHYLTLSIQRTAELKAFAQRQKVTVNTLVQAAWLLLLQRHTQQRTVAFGATVAGRPTELRGIEQQIGLFINTLPIIASPDPQQPLGEWLQALQAQNLALREYEHTPLADVQRWAGLGSEGLFDSLLVFENYPASEALAQGAPAGLEFSGVGGHEQTNYPMTLAVSLGDELNLHFIYQRCHFSEHWAQALASSMQSLLADMLAAPEGRLGTLGLLDGARQQAVLAISEQTEARWPSQRFVHQLFADQAQRTPQAVAVISGERQLTYAELEQQANQLANALVARGIGPEVRVAIALPRGVESLVAFLAVLKAGGAYVPLDIAYPRERLTFMLQDSQAALLLSHSRVLQALDLDLDAGAVLALDRLDLAGLPGQAPAVELHAQNLAYIIYTSGSTGLPKGVAVAHGPLAMHTLATGERYETSAADCELHFMSFAFDGAHEGWMHPLVNGARVLIRDDELWSPEYTYAQMHRHGVTIGVFPPVYLHQLAQHAERDGHPPAVRVYCFGGDAVPQASYELAWRALRPRYIFNGYGPTETVVTPLLWKAAAGEPCGAAYAPIGTLLGQRRGVVLDGELNLLPVGISGELYLGGVGVARGYLGRAALTAERFVPDPFDRSETGGGRLYRSGDLTTQRGDGVVDFSGRVDHQVKIRGFRIELGEIEARLLEHPAVAEAVVLALDSALGKQLVGYVVAAEDALPGIKAALSATLPAYMVPTQLIALPTLPVTPNGKLDRKQLPRPDLNARRSAYVAPRNDLEAKVANCWAEVLQQSQVGIHDNFFELGGDSIVAMQLVSRLKELRDAGVDIRLRDLMQRPSIAALLDDGGAEPGTVEQCLVPLNAQDVAGPVLFCVHGGFGTVFDYRPLAQHLEGRRALIGIQSRMIFDPNRQEASLQAMARDYVAMIRQRQAEGPYQLLGWSLGGALVVLMAAELEAQGQKVEFLGMVDGFVPGRSVDSGVDDWREDLASLLLPVGQRPVSIARPEQGLPETREHIRREIEALQALAPVGHQPTFWSQGLSTDELAGIFTVIRRLERLAHACKALPPVSATLSSWWVAGRDEDCQALSRQIAQPVAGQLVAGDHYSILADGDFIAGLERALQRVEKVTAPA